MIPLDIIGDPAKLPLLVVVNVVKCHFAGNFPGIPQFLASGKGRVATSTSRAGAQCGVLVRILDVSGFIVL